jgi:hypothetical protein
MIYRLSGSNVTLLLITLSILVGAAGVMTDQVKFLLTSHSMDFIPTEVGLEENIAILIAGFGVFLEHRRWLLERIYPNGIPDPVDQFDRYAHDMGVLLILIAIFTEAADLLFLALNSWGFDMIWLKYFEISVLFAANILAVGAVATFGTKLMKQMSFSETQTT